MAYKRYILGLFLMQSSLFTVMAQTQQEKFTLRQLRFNSIEYYHVGVGIEAEGNENFLIGSKVCVGIGSYRNLFCADVGFKLLWENLLTPSNKECVSQRQLPLFFSASVNVLRWHHSAVYIGGEFAYHLQIGGTHQLSDGKTSYSDNQLANNHTSVSIKLGTRINNWDFCLFCQRDLAPAFNQKYVYESADYDYDALHNTIFERIRFGICANYLFPF